MTDLAGCREPLEQSCDRAQGAGQGEPRTGEGARSFPASRAAGGGAPANAGGRGKGVEGGQPGDHKPEGGRRSAGGGRSAASDENMLVFFPEDKDTGTRLVEFLGLGKVRLMKRTNVRG